MSYDFDPRSSDPVVKEKGKTMGISFNAAALLNGNGIDVKSLVNAILSRQTGPLTAWQNQQTDLSTQSGLLNGLNNSLTSLAAAIISLPDPQGPLAAPVATP